MTHLVERYFKVFDNYQFLTNDVKSQILESCKYWVKIYWTLIIKTGSFVDTLYIRLQNKDINTSICIPTPNYLMWIMTLIEIIYWKTFKRILSHVSWAGDINLIFKFLYKNCFKQINFTRVLEKSFKTNHIINRLGGQQRNCAIKNSQNKPITTSSFNTNTK